MKPYITNKYEEKNNLLYEKAFAEWRNILIEFEPYTKECIVANAFEISLKQELLTVIHLRKLNGRTVNYVLSINNPIDETFRLFQDRNNEQLDYLANIVNNSVETMTCKEVRKLELCNKRTD